MATITKESVPVPAAAPCTVEDEALKRNTDCVYFLASTLTCKKLSNVWKYRKLKEQKQCHATARAQIEALDNNGYLIVEANGGLNQQRSSICNAVAVAGLLNLTLVIPNIEYQNLWQDPSDFDDIYDKQHFISTLRGVVNVVEQLHVTLMEKYDNNIPTVQVPAWSSVDYNYLGMQD